MFFPIGQEIRRLLIVGIILLLIDYCKMSDDIYFLTHSYPDCLNPHFINGYFVPCGSCILCRTNLRKEWVLRCKLENAFCKRGVFVTLTFDDDHLNDTSYRQVQLFFKKLRKNGHKIRYFGGFERGDITGRPHYHLLIWSDSITSDSVRDCWLNGFVQVSEITDSNISYVVGYTSKKLDNFLIIPSGLSSEQRSEIRKNNKYAPIRINRMAFRFMSKGLGFDYFYKHFNSLLDRGFISFHGFKYRIPRSFLNKLRSIDSDLYDRFRNTWINQDYLNIYDSFNGDQPIADEIFLQSNVLKKRQKVRDLYGKKKMFRHNAV